MPKEKGKERKSKPCKQSSTKRGRSPTRRRCKLSFRGRSRRRRALKKHKLVIDLPNRARMSKSKM